MIVSHSCSHISLFKECKFTGSTVNSDYCGLLLKKIILFCYRRRFLGLKKLDDPLDTLRKFPRQSKYEVGTAEWNPNAQEKELFAISVSEAG